jgi:peptidoglycan hydrolase-like protein with peptidoglycan-binding domain
MAEPTLHKGSRDPAVRELQQALQPLVSSPSGTVDGFFGDDTENDVISFQSDQGLDADGVVGPDTWRRIDLADLSEPVLKKGSKGNPVRRLQLTLSLGGHDTKGVDGHFGANTESSVKRLQKSAGLAADGVVGPRTWEQVNAFGD